MRGAQSDLLHDAPEFHEYDAPRIDTAHDHGAGDTWRARPPAVGPRLSGCPTPQPSARPGHRKCLKSAYPLGGGTARSALAVAGVTTPDLDDIAGVAHAPAGTLPAGGNFTMKVPAAAANHPADPHLRRGAQRGARGALTCSQTTAAPGRACRRDKTAPAFSR